MRRLVYSAVVVAALAAASAAVAVAEKRVQIPPPGPTLKVEPVAVSVRPKSLPRGERMQVAFRGGVRVSTTDGSHPPHLQLALLAIDKDVAIETGGLAACGYHRLAGHTADAARRVCGKAIVGTGKLWVRIASPDERPFLAAAPLTLFNGGVRGRVTRLFAHAFIPAPDPATLVSPIRVTERERGRFGSLAVVRVPDIADGDGALVGARLRVGRIFFHGGVRRSYLSARCRDGNLFLQLVRGVFQDRSLFSGRTSARCQTRR